MVFGADCSIILINFFYILFINYTCKILIAAVKIGIGSQSFVK